MSKLIDSISSDNTTAQIGGRWWIAKPIPFYGLIAFLLRFKDAWRVVIGKSIAVHYREDEL